MFKMPNISRQKVAFKKPIMALKFDEMDPCNVCVAMNMREREKSFLQIE